MSRQIRKTEIYRRRKRAEKLYKLRLKFKEAKSEEERKRILEKVFKVAPHLSEKEFLDSIK
jgi:hypothetical protein